LCGLPAPFTGHDGQPYLELHHIVPLEEGGSHTTGNLVALCPNCHRKMHVLNLQADVAKLKSRVLKAP
jgi:5-methylcytosine-specific restriction protein A